MILRCGGCAFFFCDDALVRFFWVLVLAMRAGGAVAVPSGERGYRACLLRSTCLLACVCLFFLLLLCLVAALHVLVCLFCCCYGAVRCEAVIVNSSILLFSGHQVRPQRI